jgi:SPP1 gp7 family putative phage head morphogenesis protein
MTASPALIEYAATRLIDLQKAVSWQQFERWTRRYRRAVEHQVRVFFRKQENEIIGNINAGKSIMKHIRDLAALKGPNQWLDMVKWQIIFEEYGQLFLPEVIGDKGQIEMEQLLIGIDFDVENPRVLAFINQRSFRFSFDTNAGTQQALRDIFNASITAGEGVPEMTRRINELFTFKKRYQAGQIARSEVIRASNFAAEQSYMQSGVVSKKQWLTSKDARVCPYCEPMQGREVVLGMVFFQRGDVLQNPDPESVATLNLDYEDIFHPPLHVQCRCTLIPILAA